MTHTGRTMSLGIAVLAAGIVLAPLAGEAAAPPGAQMIAVNVRGMGQRVVAVLRHLVPGRYEPSAGTFLAPGGRAKFYCSSDNMVDPSWTGMAAGRVIRAVDEARLTFERARGTGVVLHMLSCLAVDGRFGLTAIGDSPGEAADLYEATRAVVDTVPR